MHSVTLTHFAPDAMMLLFVIFVIKRHSMERILVALGLIIALSIACAQAGPVPATPVGGGPMPTATRPATEDSGVIPGQSPADAGKGLLTSKGCIACHTVPNVPGAVGTIGPALDGVADPEKRPTIADGNLENTPSNMRRWLSNPPAVKAGTLMPNLSLSPDEIDSLLAYIETLK